MLNVLDTFKSIEVEGKDGTIRVDEGNKIVFCTEAGEAKEGIVKSIKGKGDKAKIQILPAGKEYEELWSVMVMAEKSLEVIK